MPLQESSQQSPESPTQDPLHLLGFKDWVKDTASEAGNAVSDTAKKVGKKVEDKVTGSNSPSPTPSPTSSPATAAVAAVQSTHSAETARVTSTDAVGGGSQSAVQLYVLLPCCQLSAAHNRQWLCHALPLLMSNSTKVLLGSITTSKPTSTCCSMAPVVDRFCLLRLGCRSTTRRSRAPGRLLRQLYHHLVSCASWVPGSRLC